MAYCEKCGAQNADEAFYCNNCGAALQAAPAAEKREDECFGPKDRPEQECFGLPYGGAIVGIIFGAIIIIWAVSAIFGWDLWLYVNNYIGYIVAGLFGILIIIGALYSIRRRRY